MSFRGMQAFETVKEGGVGVYVKVALLKSYKDRWLRLSREINQHGRCRLELFEDAVSSLTKLPLEAIMLFQGDRAVVVSRRARVGVLLNFKDFSSPFKFTTASLFEADLWMQLINDALNMNPPITTLSHHTLSHHTPSITTPSHHTPSITTPSYNTPSITTLSHHTPSITTPSHHTLSYNTPSYSPMVFSNDQPPFSTATLKKRHSTSTFLVKVPPSHHLPWQTTINCLLELSSSSVSLLSIADPCQVLLRWPIEGVRRFGYGQLCFVLEPESFEDTVTLFSTEAPEIYNIFQLLSKQLSRRNSND